MITEKLDFGNSIKIGYISAVLAAVLFGSISTIAKPALLDVNPLLLSSMVYLLAGLTATPLKKKAKISEIKRKEDWLFILAMSMSGAVIAPLLYFSGLTQSKASDTSVLSNAEIVFTVLLAIVFFREKLKPIGYLAIALVLVGVIIITTNLEFSTFILDIKSEGNLLILTAMAFWGLDNNISKIASQRIDTARLVQLKSAIGGSCLMAIVLLVRVPINITVSELPNIILLGVAGFGGSLYFFLNSLKRIGTVRTILIYSTSAVFGLFFASLFLHESIGVYQIIAITMMLFGIFLIEQKDRY
ncbi:MAG TPA: DMT family transporter [Nitrososphaeraceae archaeon]|nr:DMT family transporter [Nitrososphaeraceae archaeon]